MIYEILLEGAENAISARDIADMLGCKPRDVSEQVEAERRDGKPIVASTNNKKPGYYLAGDKETMQDYCGRLLHRMGPDGAGDGGVAVGPFHDRRSYFSAESGLTSRPARAIVAFKSSFFNPRRNRL